MSDMKLWGKATIGGTGKCRPGEEKTRRSLPSFLKNCYSEDGAKLSPRAPAGPTAIIFQLNLRKRF